MFSDGHHKADPIPEKIFNQWATTGMEEERKEGRRKGWRTRDGGRNEGRRRDGWRDRGEG
jgi:hypothetical protein